MDTYRDLKSLGHTADSFDEVIREIIAKVKTMETGQTVKDWSPRQPLTTHTTTARLHDNGNGSV